MDQATVVDIFAKGGGLAATLYMLWHVFNRFTTALVEEFKGMRQDLRANTTAVASCTDRVGTVVERLARIEKGQEYPRSDTPWPPEQVVTPNLRKGVLP